MCTTCGCSSGAKTTLTNLETGKTSPLLDDDQAYHDHHRKHEHVHADGTRHSHAHDHDDHHHDHEHRHDHSHEHKPYRAGTVSVAELEARVLQKNDKLAAVNRAWFAGREILALNIVSSPGAGKTTLLERTIRDLKSKNDLFVLEGDQATSADGERIRAVGAPCVQINTGTGCHLEADMVARGLEELKPTFGSIVLIENVGNLVCPALFDLGERSKVAVFSVTEGEDKPLKYPHMFSSSELILLNKVDLLPYLDFDLEKTIRNVKIINPRATVVRLSARTGEGLDQWYDWIRVQATSVKSSQGLRSAESVDAQH
ncbi:hydrogenase nickel incorporation protein HypB [Hyphomicrobium sp.]|uniref:hydrogenase nickel incorporation protein HypB n=1 Tax=Hyphomicrobium sp. TaxID=82 RepID=UPI000FB42EC9|nr:hydrogenase nickel incorporation protein HypB [Hyphomicrobium sp.]RUP09940.1 MAG: hydrogenase accessory protein HypB [Hyphomicrobium sp.]